MRVGAAILGALCAPLALLGQVTPATGDTRPIVEPSALLNSATICAKVPATKYMVKTNAVNIDPYNPTCGSTGGTNGAMGCTGGTDYQPSSSSSSYVAAETLDNSALTAAMNSCPTGQAVELVPGASGQNAFVFGRISIQNSSGNGIYILPDAGMSMNGSRSPADYGGGSCGTISGTGTTSCNPWITISASGGGIIGYGIWYPRAWDRFTTGATTQSFYYQRLLTYCTLHGGTINGSPTCPASRPSCSASGKDCRAYGPNALQTNGPNGYIEYKATFRDSAQFIHNIEKTQNCTFWDVKLFAPFELSNTDGWDPLNTSNCTFTHGYISNGDNITALKSTSTSAPTSNISFTNNQTAAGIGIAFGTDVEGGIFNYRVSDIQMNGNLFNSAQADGLSATDGSHTGIISQVTYQNICMQNENQAAQFNMGQSTFSGLLLQNIAVLPSTAPYTTGNSGTYSFKGNSSHTVGMQIDNFQILGHNQGGSNQYASIYLGPGTVSSSLVSNLTGTGVTVSNHVSTSPAPYCSTSGWQPLTGELNINLNALGPHNNQAVSFGSSSPFTLDAVVQPTREINTKEATALTAAVQFYDNGMLIGSAPLTGDDFHAAYNVASVSSGTHNYYAVYPGDANYASFQFGAVTVINGSPSSPITLTLGGKIAATGNITVQ
jgi:Glycosyl hydrolases family 28/Bacterial Ig-like domain (group 3)